MSDSLDLVLSIYLLLKSSYILPSSNIRLLSYSHFTMNKTIFIAAMLAVVTVLAAGLAVLPSSIQEAQANPCASEVELDSEQSQSGDLNADISTSTSDDERECNFVGPVDLEED
jgi:hypothetical protein